MEKMPTKQGHQEMLGIDKLVASLTQLLEESKRLKRDKTESLIRLMVNEIPYAHEIIPNTLAESFLSDAPHTLNDLKMNEVIANLGFALFDANQKNELIELVRAYLQLRKKTERAYAEALLPDILPTEELKQFPEKARPELIKIAQTILEKVINEKQLRRIPGYRLESLLAVVEPLIYHRLFNPELDRLRITHHLAFRKFVNTVAQDGYEKIHDETKLTIIHNEKELAFSQFAHAIIQKAVVYPQLETEHAKLRFLQKDRIIKNTELKKILDEFFKSTNLKTMDGLLGYHIRIRLTEKMRKNIQLIDADPAIYQNEFTIKQAHDAIFKEVKDDFYALKFLIAKVKLIRENFHKQFFHIFMRSKELTAIDTVLTDTLLGKAIIKTDLITGEKHVIREGGYPKIDIKIIYSTVIAQLQTMSNNISGIFAKKLMAEILRMVAELCKVGEKLHATRLIALEEASEPELTAEVPIEQISPATPIQTEKEKTTAIIQPAQTEKITKPLSMPIAEEPIAAFEPEPVKEEAVKEKPATMQPLLIPEEANEEPVTTSNIKPEEEKISTKPLSISFEEEPAVQEEKAATPLTLPAEEKVATKPLLTTEEESTPESSLSETHDEATQEVLDSGAMIMKNYQLGEFEKPIYSAWKIMTAHSNENHVDVSPGLMNLSSDNDVKLYVICDLAQQVTAINVTPLNDSQKQILQGIKTQLVDALKDPLDEANWDYFEGMHRDIIDGQLGSF